jgi:geranylgeranyl diphosphate synthase type I
MVATSSSCVGERVERRVDELLESEQERWSTVDAELAALFETLAELVRAPAKRLRPAFCYWAFVGAGGDPSDDRWVDIGAALELLHAFALFHDDVMDGAATRRGARTAHLVHADRHRAGDWIGEARRYGEGVAILAGDLAHVYADRLLIGVPAAVVRVWSELRIELNLGQYLDIVGTARGERSRTGAMRIARYKSAKYTIERPLHLGALLAGATPELLDGLSAYGLPLGDAFQLRDDVLGAFGDEAKTGKPVGHDLREGKPTLLLAVATARADPSQAAVLRTVGTPLTPVGVAAVQRALVETGARAEIECRIRGLADEAIAALDHMPLVADATPALVELAEYVAERDS